MTTSMNIDDVASGCFHISGHWGMISGTATTVMRGLDIIKTTECQLVSMTYNDTTKEFIAFIHR